MPQEYDYLAIVDERPVTQGGYEYNLVSASSPIVLDSSRPWQLTLAPERYLMLGSYDSQDPIVEEMPVIIQGASQDITEVHKLRMANMLSFLATRYAKGMQQTPIKLKMRARGSSTIYECLILGQVSEDDPTTVIDPDYGEPRPNKFIVPNVTLRFKRRGPIVAAPVDYALTNLVNAPDPQWVTMPNIDITSPLTLRFGSFNGSTLARIPDLTILAARSRNYMHMMTHTGAASVTITNAGTDGTRTTRNNPLFTNVATGETSSVLISLASDVRRVKVFVVARATVATDVWSIQATFFGGTSRIPASTTIGGADFAPGVADPRVVYAGTAGFPNFAPASMVVQTTRISGSGGLYIDQVYIIAADDDTSTVIQTQAVLVYTNAWGNAAASQIAYLALRYDPRSSYRPVVQLENIATPTLSPIPLSSYGLPILRTIGTEFAFTVLGPDLAYVLTTTGAQNGTAMQLDGIATRYTRSMYPM